jgi:hypothetical protein
MHKISLSGIQHKGNGEMINFWGHHDQNQIGFNLQRIRISQEQISINPDFF